MSVLASGLWITGSAIGYLAAGVLFLRICVAHDSDWENDEDGLLILLAWPLLALLLAMLGVCELVVWANRQIAPFVWLLVGSGTRKPTPTPPVRPVDGGNP